MKGHPPAARDHTDAAIPSLSYFPVANSSGSAFPRNQKRVSRVILDSLDLNASSKPVPDSDSHSDAG